MEYTVNAVEKGRYSIRIRAQGEGILSASFGELKAKSSLSLPTWQTADLESFRLKAENKYFGFPLSRDASELIG